jgi:crotonobetainyl-CoA:carnitine CoA-transferase CaiB-like acyl-CoA transferase
VQTCLEGIRILELTHFIAGPFCGQILAGMGADVIKIERPGEGEVGRQLGPHYKGESLYYTAFNLNKRAVTLNLQSEKGREMFKQMVREADVVIENLRPGVLDRMGLGYRDLSQLNPRLILTSISGFGQYGPYRDRQALDMVIQAMGGMMDLTGFPEGPPVKAGPVIADITTGIYGALGTMLALFARERYGIGQHVDMAMLDGLVTLLENAITVYLLQGTEIKRAGNNRPLTAPSNAYQAIDGYLYISANADNLFHRLMHLIGRPDLSADPRFAGAYSRKQNEAELDQAISHWVAARSVAEAVNELDQAGIPSGPVNSIAQVAKDPHLKAREMILEVEHPVMGILPLLGFPVKLSATPGTVRLPPATLGQHNQEVYRELLGMTEEELAALRQEGVI